jgi:hypothetical protein
MGALAGRITSSLRLAGIAGLRLGRGASYSRPVKIELLKPLSPARGFLVARLSAISKSVLPSAAKRINWARRTNLWTRIRGSCDSVARKNSIGANAVAILTLWDAILAGDPTENASRGAKA